MGDLPRAGLGAPPAGGHPQRHTPATDNMPQRELLRTDRIPGSDRPVQLRMLGALLVWITFSGQTDATVTDSAMTRRLHQMLAARGLLPAEHHLDSGYPSAEPRVLSRPPQPDPPGLLL